MGMISELELTVMQGDVVGKAVGDPEFHVQ